MGVYLPKTGRDVFDSDELGPVAQTVRDAWGAHSTPVASAEFAAAVLVAVEALERRVAALEG